MANFDQIVLSHVNDELGTAFVPGYTGPCTLDGAARAAARAAFSVKEAELALALLAAEIMGLKMDTQFFPGPLPENSCETLFALELLPGNTGKSMDFREGRARLCGRSPSRRVLMECWGKFLEALPLCSWITVNSNLQQNAVTFCRIEPGKGESRTGEICRSLEGYSAEITLDILICISPPAPVLS